jgi:hypothetical protein
LERVSAGALIRHLPGASADPVRGRVVVIGASFEDSRDLHETPVGTLPGALVMLDAIKSLNQFGPLHGPAARGPGDRGGAHRPDGLGSSPVSTPGGPP